MRGRVWSTVAAALLAVGPADGDGVAHRVVDLGVEPQANLFSSTNATGSLGGVALFGGAMDLSGDGGLWTTTGNPSSTRLLNRIFPDWIVPFASGAVMAARSAGTGVELWWTDGTTAGTRLLRDIRPGFTGSEPFFVGEAQNLVFFGADDGVHGWELWRTDGTEAGTILLKDLRPGPWGGLGSLGQALGSHLYFAADDGVEGGELWRSDGTPEGTQPFHAFRAGPAGGWPDAFLRALDRLFFVAADDDHGRELWSTDGSPAGTALVLDVRTGAEGSRALPLGTGTGRLLFSADDGAHGFELWSTDGTAAGTALLRDIRPGPGGSTTYSTVAHLGTQHGGRVVLLADDGIVGLEPWASDGTAAGTILLADVYPGPVGDVSGLDATPLGVFFARRDPQHLPHLWRTDGTPAGTAQVVQLPRENVSGFATAGAREIFELCRCPIHDECSCTVWRTDGTAAGTGAVVPFDMRTPASIVQRLGDGPELLFSTGYGTSGSLYRTDGSEEGTQLVDFGGEPALGVNLGARLEDGGALLGAFLETTQESELWSVDDGGASFVADIWPGAENGSGPSGFRRVGDEVYLTAEDGEHGRELWRSDGSAAGTVLVSDLEPGPNSSYLETTIVEAGGRAWFAASTTSEGEEIWESSGTPATTFPHQRLPGPSPDWQPIHGLDELAGGDLVAVENFDFYRTSPGAEELTAWWSFDERLQEQFAYPTTIVVGDTVYFFDLLPAGDCGLWRSDATPGGTTLVRAVGSGTWGACPEGGVSELGGAIYFAACEPASGCELWRSDGTTAGTSRLLDLAPGPFSSVDTAPTAIGDRLYFRACKDSTGCEPWVTDGSAAGTHILSDLVPGPFSGSPYWGHFGFVAAGDWIYFAGDDGTGTELWAAPFEVFYDGFEGGNLDRWSSVGP